MKRIINPLKSDYAQLLARPAINLGGVLDQVRPIIEQVRSRGDAALREYTERFDRAVIEDFEVQEAEIFAATVAPELEAAMRLAKGNIEQFHQAQSDSAQSKLPVEIVTQPGVHCWRKKTAIEKVGLYVPGGTAPLFSTLLMLAVPAVLAGCREIVVCTPPAPDGSIHSAILVAARIAGVKRIFKLGGAQAIAAMAVGTESVPQVDKIFGPGNHYVTSAKLLIFQNGVAIDLPAGPSEVAVIADSSAVPEFVAADLLSQAEHGPDSQVILVSDSLAMLDAVDRCLTSQLAELPRQKLAAEALKNSLSILVESISEAIELINAYAPEHLILQVNSPRLLAEKVRHAGSVFLGPYSPESVGDYASGTNHVLPTNGAARAFSGVSLDSFSKSITFQELTASGLHNIGASVEILAEAEGLEAHKKAVSIRLEQILASGLTPKCTQPKARSAEVNRSTTETKIRVKLDLDGTGESNISTGLGFFDHMLQLFARHSGIDLTVETRGDLHVDEHHTIEDTGIALGEALTTALGEKRGIERYGFLLPMDEALAQAALDLSGRSWLVWNVPLKREKIGDVPTEMFYHFFKSLSDSGKFNLHLEAKGDNEHHIIEGVFKAFARALKMAIKRGEGDQIPSTKGLL